MRISDWSSDVCSSDLIRELSADDLAASCGIDGDVSELEHALFRISAAVLQLELHLRRATTARYVTGKQLLAQAQHIGARLLDLHEDRLQPLDRGERVGLRSGAERADGVFRAPDADGVLSADRVTRPVDYRRS